MGEDMHPSRVEPTEERLVVLVRLVDELQGAIEEFLVHGFHRLGVERTGILHLLLANFSKLRTHRAVIRGRSPRMQNATGTELLLEVRILGIIGIFPAPPPR